jgi:hypothetical protein
VTNLPAGFAENPIYPERAVVLVPDTVTSSARGRGFKPAIRRLRLVRA